ncbi:TlpA family protein disulfide reductase [Pedobacter sp. ISL-68]|uniref:TlpA family protein disulfide reductase n=1 Tax=unclassified Pedobacter TaxID=2628915 RepID=UPI001BE84841|nr:MULTISPECIES: TlpA disulfide reductase family protein [unclassified Pedobacter]MBT2560205.1 TlpA family protein disulfide reductase [Pedobacter sp. ISL-64]MBT2589184.1 TlpA family protein disulfide reductase [Pedobacter sp. ISL-68]
MKRHFFTRCWLLLCPFFGQQLAAQTLTWNPEIPLQQKKVSFSYNPKGGELEFSDDPKALLAYYENSNWKTVALSLKKDKENLLGEYSVPAGAAFFALKFYQGDVLNPEAFDNNNGKGYLRKVLSPKGKEVVGSYLSEAALRAGLTGNWTLNSFINPSKNARMIDSLLIREEKLSHSSHRSYLFTYLDLKQATMPAPAFVAFADGLMKTEIKKGNLNEELLAGMQRYYIRLKDTKSAEMVAQLIFQNYPKSGTARFLAFGNITKGKSGSDLTMAYEEYLKKFPYADWKKSPDGKGHIYYEIFRGLGAQYFESGEIEKFLSLFREIDFKTANEIYRWNITKGQMMGKVDRKMLYGVSKKILPYLIERQKDNSYLIDFGNDQKKAQDNADNQLNDRLYTHIFFANDQADYVGGNQFFQYLSKEGSYNTADLNALHLNILERLGGDKSIKLMLEKSVAANAVTPVMFTRLKTIYVAEHGKEEGYDQYLSSLMPNDKKAEMRIHVMANMVNYPLVPFTLEDADGKMVNSKDWAGKVVVIDFWATWCRPCIMAFPGMQLLVDQYAKDPAVGVYMIGTMQNGDYKTKSVNYVRGEGYRFNLLHDAIGSKGEQDQVFKSLVPFFRSSAIPRKIIIKNGEVRYSSEGYSGSPSQLRDELSMAVEILRAEK